MFAFAPFFYLKIWGKIWKFWIVLRLFLLFYQNFSGKKKTSENVCFCSRFSFRIFQKNMKILKMLAFIFFLLENFRK